MIVVDLEAQIQAVMFLLLGFRVSLRLAALELGRRRCRYYGSLLRPSPAPGVSRGCLPELLVL